MFAAQYDFARRKTHCAAPPNCVDHIADREQRRSTVFKYVTYANLELRQNGNLTFGKVSLRVRNFADYNCVTLRGGEGRLVRGM